MPRNVSFSFQTTLVVKARKKAHFVVAVAVVVVVVVVVAVVVVAVVVVVVVVVFVDVVVVFVDFPPSKTDGHILL